MSHVADTANDFLKVQHLTATAVKMFFAPLCVLRVSLVLLIRLRRKPRPSETVAKRCPAELDGLPRHENSSTHKTESFRFVPFATASSGREGIARRAKLSQFLRFLSVELSLNIRSG